MGKAVPFTDELRAEYERLYAEADIPEAREPEAAQAAQKLLANWPRYETVATTLGIPPHPIALIHAMESDCDFGTHLHNGDPLTARTVHQPPNRPATGEPPYTWEASAMDALRLHELDKWSDWSIAGLCYVLERYNGWGYRLYHQHVKSPYLWSFTSIYTAGKYTSDGKWSDTAVSKQVGAMALLMELVRQGQAYPVAQEVANAQAPDSDVVPTPAQSPAPVVQTQGLRSEPANSGQMGDAIRVDLPDAARVTVGGIVLSKKLCALAGGVLLLLFGPTLGLNLTPDQQKSITDALCAYLVAQGAADFGAPLVGWLKRYAESHNA